MQGITIYAKVFQIILCILLCMQPDSDITKNK